MNKIFKSLLYGITMFLVISNTVHASLIISAVSATASSTEGLAYDIGNTIDQSGLNIGYTSGVTDFDTYMALNPVHTMVASNNEWFSELNTLSAVIDYDLGSIFTVDRLAIWNDEYSGIGLIDVLFSLDGSTYTSVATGLTPTDHPANVPITYSYPADIFALATGDTRYVRLEATACPQPDNFGPFCGMGEIAFSAAVPEPATLALMALGLAGLGFTRRKTG